MPCDYDFDGQTWFINILFQYMQDERFLYVLAIAKAIADPWYRPN